MDSSAVGIGSKGLRSVAIFYIAFGW